MRACLYATLLCSLGASACDASFWQSFNQANPDNCVTSQSACPSGMACSQVSQICELIPDVTSVDPALASGAGGARVRVQGTNFGADTGLWFGQSPGAAATQVAVMSETLLEATVPANPGDSWAVPVTVGTPGASTTRSGLFSYYAAKLSFAPEKVDAVNFAQYIDVADINQDGNLDLVIMSTSPHAAAILLGQGDGTFLQGASLLTPDLNSEIHALDLNNDKYPDLVILSATGIDVFLNDRQGSFPTSRHFATDAVSQSPSPGGASFADWNRDGAIDIAVSNATVDRVTLLANDGQGAFGTPQEIENGTKAASTISGDFNGDGKPDLVSASINSPLRFYAGNGSGGFSMIADVAANGCEPLAGKAADLNEDGLPDLVVSCLGDKSVRVAFGKAGGGFQSADTPISKHPTVPSFTIADYNGDHHLDLGIFSPSEATFNVRSGDGAGGFAQAASFTLSGGSPGRTGTAVGDFNSDSRPDFIAALTPMFLFVNRSK